MAPLETGRVHEVNALLFWHVGTSKGCSRGRSCKNASYAAKIETAFSVESGLHTLCNSAQEAAVHVHFMGVRLWFRKANSHQTTIPACAVLPWLQNTHFREKQLLAIMHTENPIHFLGGPASSALGTRTA